MHSFSRAVMAELPFALQRMAAAPLALAPRRAVLTFHGLQAGALRAGSTPAIGAPGADSGDGYFVQAGLAVIRIAGVLLHSDLAPQPFGPTGYGSVAANLQRALADRAVRGIVLHLDSDGGEVGGMLAVAEEIYAARGRKPIVAIADEHALAGAYVVASAADRVVVPRTGSLGSVGVVVLVPDISRALDGAGVTVNVIEFGSQKSAGLPVQPLAPEARAKFQRDVDVIGDLMVRTVARNRALTPRAVRALEGASLLGAAALRAGLADAVLSAHEAFARFAESVAAPSGAGASARAGTPRRVR